MQRQSKKRLMAEAPKKWGDDQKLMLTHILFDGKLPRFLGFDRGPVTVIGNGPRSIRVRSMKVPAGKPALLLLTAW